MKRFGLIGYPLSHSFSARFFNDKFRNEGLTDHVYDLFPIESISDIEKVLHDHPDLVGLNVTIPYKRPVLEWLDHYKETLPQGLDACNCIRILDGKMTGYNTDVIGFEKSFIPLLQPHHTNALVLGNGGATAAVKFVLKKLGIAFNIVSRELHEGSTITYADIDRHVIELHTIIINTSPVGTFPDTDAAPAIPYQFISDRHYMFDLIYNPSRTLFLQRGEEHGARIQNGYDMLVIQAEESWKIWNG